MYPVILIYIKRYRPMHMKGERKNTATRTTKDLIIFFYLQPCFSNTLFKFKGNYTVLKIGKLNRNYLVFEICLMMSKLTL